VANTVHKAINNELPLSEVNTPNEAETVNLLTKKIARQVTNNIPKETITALINEAKGLIKIIESSCADRNSDEESESSSEYRNESPKIVD